MKSSVLNLTLLLVLASLTIGLLSCGKINSRPDSKIDSKADSKTKTPPHEDNPSEKQIKTTKKKEFYLYFKEMNNLIELGDNFYQLRVISSKNLENLSKTAKIKVIYFMPDMPEMGTSEAVLEPQEDHSYRVSLFYSMPGLWEINIKIEDKGLQDEYASSFEL